MIHKTQMQSLQKSNFIKASTQVQNLSHLKVKFLFNYGPLKLENKLFSLKCNGKTGIVIDIPLKMKENNESLIVKIVTIKISKFH
jgi:hypothetical protein